MYTVLGYNDISLRILPFSFKSCRSGLQREEFLALGLYHFTSLVKRKVSQAQECSLDG